MTATFLVTIEVASTDPGTLEQKASEIEDSCQADGLTVHNVEPWARPTQEPQQF